MRLIRGQALRGADVVGFLVIGDGSMDERILKALLRKFNDEKIVLMPQARPALGLDGSLDQAAYLIGRFGMDVLIVIDKEHFDDERFERLLGERFSEREEKERAGSLRHLWVRRGQRSASLFVAVMGHERRIEENLAILIRELLGEEIEGTKGAVWGFLKRLGLHVSELVRRASEEQLKVAFSTAFIEFLKRWSRKP